MRAQATLVNGLGGPRDFGTSCLSGSDDGSSPAIPLASAFPMGLNFFGTTQTTAYVNVNGNITFNGPQACYTPSAFPIAMRPMIAPFWGDVDLRTYQGAGPLGTRRCNGPEGMPPVMGMCPVQTITSCSNPANNGIWYHLESNRMVVTWDQVGYYQCQDAAATRNSFQLILTAVAPACGMTTAGTDFDVEFRYNACHWEVGQASGDANGNGLCDRGERMCTPAQAGFDAGNLMDFTQIMGSRMNGIANALCTGSNTTPPQPGVWQFQVRGGVVMTCPNAGMPCTVPGQMGVCANGRLNCAAGTSTATCVQQVTPNAERCDNEDNDCNGMVDDAPAGTNLCSTLQICQAGACVDGCFEGTCPTGYVCDASRCVDASCAGVTCPAGQRCTGGTCMDACAGVTCPAGQMCTAGRCVDPCSGITCDSCTACVGGSCIARCSSSSCPSGQTCDADGRCVETACAGVSCMAGTYCMGGTCVDACTGVTCPAGQVCSMGACLQTALPDAAVVRPDVGIVFNDAAIPPGNDSGVVRMDAGPTTDAGHIVVPMRTSGSCGCRATSERSWGGALGLGLVALVLGRRRRKG